jgi:hypothetical protein
MVNEERKGKDGGIVSQVGVGEKRGVAWKGREE